MAHLVLRVRFTSGDHIDVSVERPDTDDAAALEDVVTTLARDSGTVRTSHGGRTLVLFGRGVAAVEVAPRGAVL
jgi:hypothetical protein